MILRDPTYRRLNTLTTLLAARAGELVGREVPPATGRLAAGASQLLLWESRSHRRGIRREMAVASMWIAMPKDNYGYCAEAASLLLSDDVPVLADETGKSAGPSRAGGPGGTGEHRKPFDPESVRAREVATAGAAENPVLAQPAGAACGSAGTGGCAA